MKPQIKLLIIWVVVLLIIFSGIAGYFYFKKDISNSSGSNSCTDMGCQKNELYVGSINSDKYYPCDCHYADRILPENIICFSSDQEAVDMGYTKSDC